MNNDQQPSIESQAIQKFIHQISDKDLLDLYISGTIKANVGQYSKQWEEIARKIFSDNPENKAHAQKVVSVFIKVGLFTEVELIKYLSPEEKTLFKAMLN